VFDCLTVNPTSPNHKCGMFVNWKNDAQCYFSQRTQAFL
jgi:hypothetical protein